MEKTAWEILSCRHQKRSPVNESAADMILRLSHEYSGELTLLTTAPLTNIAVALLRDPDLAGRIRKLVIMGGAVFHWKM